MNTQLQQTAPGHYTVRGELTFATVPQLWLDSRPQVLQAPGSLTIDLSGVSRADSAALSLLVEWVRLCTSRGLSLTFQHLPAHLATMARTYNLEPLLPIHG